ncbi:integrase catalytic domain-containing protein [Trichonephila clavata]|uniref:Integrase catalytic domain-containing protein n=1 Tax=Trichonephila clavata TaxID=2740835 RepID=A0A8X6G1H6_TRICU|nr:integrase catalytic domain-containing protein [Trichonephila clavata]
MPIYNCLILKRKQIKAQPFCLVAELAARQDQKAYIKLPTVNINTFYGEIEEFHSFWERFENCIDKNESLSQIDKHVFLRGYLDAEAKRLVDGISITADTYTMIKEILKSKYGNKDKIIQAHLDYLENLTPIKDLSPSALNELVVY